jgi:FAD dependent oxidoreductase
MLNRRQFIRIVGGVSVVSVVAPTYGLSRGSSEHNSILLEAASFSNPGGWVLDTQFYQQIGGCYLMAHGMGKPVKDATTVIETPDVGKWYVFVRTKDWCPGEWEAPGQFKLLVNDKPLDSVFGTQLDWGWQRGGEVKLEKGKTRIALRDLTGFCGRCDAIYFSREPNPTLPNSPKDILEWKDQQTGRSQLNIQEDNFDVVIVGGGITGCAAALAADSQGLKVALVHDRPVFGGNASEEVRVHTIGIHGKSADILKKIDTEHYPNGSAEAKESQRKRETTMQTSSVHLFANHLAVGLELEGKRIASVDARNSSSGIIRRLRASQFIDCTGDGWLGYWAGADYRYGREAHSEFDEQFAQHGDLWSPAKADNKVMGTSVLWNSYKADKPSKFPKVPWAMPVAGNHTATKGRWTWEYSNNELSQIDDAEQIRDHVLRAIFGSFFNAKKQPKNALLALDWVAYVGGRRESRRIMGDYIYSMKDAVEQRIFEDAVVEEERELDSHYQLAETGNPADFQSKALYYKIPGKYYLPFRSLYAKDISNLMIAGRCFSCTHIGLAGPRVMNTCGQMGVATGYAAVLCKKHKATPREVGKSHIKELRSLIGYT